MPNSSTHTTRMMMMKTEASTPTVRTTCGNIIFFTGPDTNCFPRGFSVRVQQTNFVTISLWPLPRQVQSRN
jgi:hypothetical protein